MIAAYRSFTALDRADRRLVFEAAVLIALAWVGLRLFRFATLRRILDRVAGSPASGTSGLTQAARIGRVAWAITAISARFPSATCLVQALAANAMLRRRGVACELRIGVRTVDNAAEPIEAHAWVDCGGAVAVGAVDDLADFTVLATLPGSMSPPDCTGRFATLLAGEATAWTQFRMTPAAFLRTCEDEGLTGLVHQRLSGQEAGWPVEVRDAIAKAVRAQTATELLRQRQLIEVLDALAAEGISPVVLKGAALAHSLYESPAARPRADTDLLIRRDQVDHVRRVLGRRGYAAPTQCDGEVLFCQFCLKHTDQFGLVHVLDVHWKISTQSVFADVLRFDEVAARAVPLPALGRHARMAGPVHALILACIHPVMHHRNAESLLWTYDVHLLASRLSEREFAAFVELAVARRVSAICAHQLARAREWLGTRVPDAAMTTLAAVGDREPSAAYMQPGRQWSDEMRASLRGLPRWSDRVRLLREVTLPGPAYMRQAYGVTSSPLGSALLPLLYCHRLVLGGWKVLARRK